MATRPVFALLMGLVAGPGAEAGSFDPSVERWSPALDSRVGARPAIAPAALPVLPLVWVDPTDVALAFADEAREEAALVLAQTGLDVSWRVAPAGELAGDEDVTVILLGHAAFDAEGAPVLGSTPKTFAGPQFASIHVASIRALLRLDRPNLLLDPVARRNLGIAVGRVIAHEVIHVLAPAIEHGNGLMSHSFDARDLSGRRPAVGRAVASAVRESAFRRQRPVSPPASAVGVEASLGRAGMGAP